MREEGVPLGFHTYGHEMEHTGNMKTAGLDEKRVCVLWALPSEAESQPSQISCLPRASFCGLVFCMLKWMKLLPQGWNTSVWVVFWVYTCTHLLLKGWFEFVLDLMRVFLFQHSGCISSPENIMHFDFYGNQWTPREQILFLCSNMVTGLVEAHRKFHSKSVLRFEENWNGIVLTF